MLAGDARALARAITLVENDAPEGHDLVRQLYPRSGRARIIGVTGPPGAGKSTLVNAMTVALRRAERTVGVVAVDPSSPFSGGAVLGDRVRMGAHAQDAGVFVRSMATRGQLGGLSRAAGDAALVLDAAGRDVVFIETVGVGQDEVDIVQAADVSVVVLVPGAGDDVQAMKAGIMEIADVFAVNKADHDGADELVRAIAAALALQPAPDGAWTPPIVKTEATTGQGIDELLAAIAAFEAHDRGAGERAHARADHRLREALARRAVQELETRLSPDAIEAMAARVAQREIDPYSAAAALIAQARTRPS